jgi:hypothetical protein
MNNEPVAYQYRTFYGEDTVTPGWGEWELVEQKYPLQTLEQRVQELLYYISKGYKYEVRALYVGPILLNPPQD